MEHILARLALDSRPVSRRLVSLIFNSFLPVNQPEEVWCERCVTLLQMNRAAARKFYQHAHEHTACTNIGTDSASACPSWVHGEHSACSALVMLKLPASMHFLMISLR